MRSGSLCWPACWCSTDLAISLSNLSTDLAELGRINPDGLVAVEEAAGIHRQLAQAEPDRYMPELAATLVNLAALLAKLGRAAEARARAQEAAGIYSVLARTYPDRFLPDLAISFTNLGALLADLGQAAEALPAAEYAVSVYRQLTAINPDRYLLELAS
jgi:tetratricopeptide (TPR) repeat protein